MRRFWTTLLALPLAFASCSDMPEADTKPAAGTIEVSIGSGPKIDIRTGAQTRTELGEDGVTVQWADNDCIALWAVDSQGQKTIDRQVFKLWHYNEEYNTAKFTATVPEMPEDTYTYYAVSPVPFEANRLEEALYRIPAEQDGTFNGDYDIMVAHPIEGSALQQGDNSQTVNLQFEHKVHVLKIHIPSRRRHFENHADFPRTRRRCSEGKRHRPHCRAATDQRQQCPDAHVRHPEKTRRHGFRRHRPGRAHVSAVRNHHRHGNHPRIAAAGVCRKEFHRRPHHPDRFQHSDRRSYHPAHPSVQHRR